MFSSKIKPHEPEAPTAPPFESPVHATIAPLAEPRPSPSPIPAAKPKPAASVLSSDLTIQGNVLTSGDIQIEGVVEGDIIHKTIAIESGAHFEGSVQRQEDPLGKSKEPGAPASRVAAMTAAE